MGKHTRHSSGSSRRNPILSPNMDHLPPQARGVAQHTHDAHSNTRELRLGRKLSSETGYGGVEYVGCVSGYGCAAGVSVSNGDLL